MFLKIIYLYLPYIISNIKNPTTFKLKSKKKDERLIHEFEFYYGSSEYGFNPIYCEIDLYYDKSILLSKDISNNGIICNKENECEKNKKSHYIVTNNQDVIETNLSYIPLYLELEDESKEERDLKLEFELLDKDNITNENNLIGLNYNSKFLFFISKLYKKEQIWFSITTDTDINKNMLFDKPEEISISLTFFENRFLENYFFQKSNCLELKDFSIDFSGILINDVPGQIDINLPYLLKLSPDIYDEIIKRIKIVICKNINQCYKREDVYNGYDNNQRLTIIFKSREKNLDNFSIKIFVEEMFYYDNKDFIQYNFDFFKKKNKKIIFGILFMNRIDLIIYYEDFGKKDFLMYLSKKEKKKKNFLWEILVIAFFIALVICYFLFRYNTPKEDFYKSRKSFLFSQ